MILHNEYILVLDATLYLLQLKEMDNLDMVTLVIQEMSKEFPTLMDTLVRERDQLVLSHPSLM